MSYLFAFSYYSWGSQGKNTEVVCHSLLQWTTFCQTSAPWPVHLGWPHTAWLSFIELNKAVVRVIRLASCLWLRLQSVCPLMPSLSAYHLGFLLPWTWGISSQLLQQSTAAAPYLGHGVAPLGPKSEVRGGGPEELTHVQGSQHSTTIIRMRAQFPPEGKLGYILICIHSQIQTQESWRHIHIKPYTWTLAAALVTKTKKWK